MSGEQIVTTRRQYQQSFMVKCQENDDIPTTQLSGDEASEQSIHASSVDGHKSNFLLTVTTVMKTVIGAGILGLPFTVSRSGYIFSLVLFLLIVSANQFTCVLLLKSKNLSKHSNYSSIIYHIFQNKFSQALCNVFILINNIGICIVELTIFKEVVRKLLEEYIHNDEVKDAFYTSTYLIVIILGVLEIPFTLVKKMEKLKFMAFLGVAGIAIFVVCLVINFFAEMGQQDWSSTHQLQPFPTDILQFASVVPNLMLALNYQMNFFPIYKGLKNSCDSKMAKASFTGICGCTFFYIIVGYIGYILYGQSVKPNFLVSLKKDQISPVLYLGMNMGFSVSIFFSFPVMFFGARNNFIALMKMIFLRDKKKQIRREFQDNVEEISSYMEPTLDRQQAKKKAQIYFYLYTAVLFIVAISVAIAVDDIEPVFNVVGAIASNSIGFILPSLFYWQLVKKKEKKINWKYFVAVFCFFWFIPFGIFSIISQFIKGQ